MTQPSSLLHTEPDMASSVTRHGVNPEPREWKVISCGIDTLDFGVYIDWQGDWDTMLALFDSRKASAFGTDGILIQDDGVRDHLFLPSGKPPSYRYHLQFPEYHLFIGISREPKHDTPNVYVSFNSETLWSRGTAEAVKLLLCDLDSMGGLFRGLKPSRCDICVDIYIPGGLRRDFLESFMVSRGRKTNAFMNGDVLETFYAGAKDAPIQIRIYNKGLEIGKKATEQRWLDIWQVDDSTDIWRFEFEIKRAALREFQINSFPDLEKKIADLWRYLTEEWFSLRYPDNEKTERRGLHPLWLDVRGCSEQLGEQSGGTRHYSDTRIRSLAFNTSRIAGFAISRAALEDTYDQKELAKKISHDLLVNLNNRDFPGEVKKKQIKLSVNHVDWKSINEKLKRGNTGEGVTICNETFNKPME